MASKDTIMKAVLNEVASALEQGAAGPTDYWFKKLAERLRDRARSLSSPGDDVFWEMQVCPKCGERYWRTLSGQFVCHRCLPGQRKERKANEKSSNG
jgi:hypothetical protein